MVCAEDLVKEDSWLYRKLSKEKIGFFSQTLLGWIAENIYTRLSNMQRGLKGIRHLRDYERFFHQQDFLRTPGWEIFKSVYEEYKWEYLQNIRNARGNRERCPLLENSQDPFSSDSSYWNNIFGS